MQVNVINLMNGPIAPYKADFVIYPGENKFDRDAWDKMRRRPDLCMYLAKGMLKVEGAEAGGVVHAPKAEDLSGMKAVDAVTKVERTDDAAKLASWAEKEGRKTVLGAIQQRLADLEEPDDEPSDEG